MNKHIINLRHIRGIQLIAEPPEPFIKHPRLKRAIGCHQTIHSEIELFTSNEHGVVDIPGDDPNVISLEVFEG